MVRLSSALIAIVISASANAQTQATSITGVQSLDNTNSGYVIASEASGQWLFVTNAETQQNTKMMGIYCRRLPVGHYTLYKIGTSYGSVTSKSPFIFDVAAGQTNYIGTVAGPRISDSKRYAAYREANPVIRIYDLHDLFSTTYKYTLFSRLDDLGDRYLSKCPDIVPSQITVSLMK